MTTTKISLLAVVLAAAIASPVAAETAKDRADALFYEGKANMARKQYDTACSAFQMSHELDPKPVALLQLAECREANGQLASAHAALEALAELVRNQKGANAATFANAARDRLTKLAPRVSKLHIKIPPDGRVAGLEVFRDASRLDEARWNSDMPIDGGTYKVSARAPNHREWTTTVTVRPESDTQSVDIPRLAATPSVTPEPPKGVDPPRVEPTKGDAPPPNGDVVPGGTMTTTTERVDAPRAKSPLRFVALGGAIALLGGGVALELSARSVYDKSVVEPDRDRQLSQWRSANTRRYAAQGLAVAGIASAGIATWLFVRGGREPRVAVTPVATPDAVGVTITGGFR